MLGEPDRQSLNAGEPRSESPPNLGDLGGALPLTKLTMTDEFPVIDSFRIFMLLQARSRFSYQEFERLYSAY